MNLLYLLLLACSSPATPEIPMTPEQLLDQLESLGGLVPFAPNPVGDALDVSLVRDGGSEPFHYYKASLSGPFTSVWLMAPQSPAAAGGILKLSLSGSVCVTAELAKTKFGWAHGVAPNHSQPKPQPRFVQHPLDWGNLKMRYDPQTGCLVEAILDAK